MDFKAAVQEAFSNLSSTAEVTIPDDSADLHSVISRWSDADVHLPALVVVPSTEDDIITAVHFARSHKLKLVPANGKHGSYVPVTDKTLYLDLKKFNTVSVDEGKAVATIGGGVNTGQVLQTLSDHGYYTPCVNSNTVGVVGAILGCGSGPFNGLHGPLIDNVVSIRLITSSGELVDLDESSTGDKAALFNVCCGAGHGMGIITSLGLRAYPLSSLKMDENKIFVKRIIFPGSEISAAAELYVSFLPPAPHLTPSIVFARAPPNAPVPGAPTIILTISYFGPSTSAERDMSTILSPSSHLTSKALSVTQFLNPVALLNSAADPMNRHGGFKEAFGTLSQSITVPLMQDVFRQWLDLGAAVPDARPSYLLFTAWDTAAMLSHPQHRFFPWRDKGVMFLATLWYNNPKSRAEVAKAGDAMLSAVRTAGGGAKPPASFPTGLRRGMDLEECYTSDMIEEVKRVKGIWDPEGVLWSPVTDGI